MSYDYENIILCKGRSLQDVNLCKLLMQFDAKRLLLRMGDIGSQSTVEINAETAGGLDALRTESLYVMMYEDLRPYKLLEQHGVVQVETIDESHIVSHTISRGSTYPNTSVVGIRKPLFLGFSREARYFPVR